MGETVRARFVNARLEPTARLDLPEGQEVMVTILEIPRRQDRELPRRAAGAWEGAIDAEALIRNIYADRLSTTKPEPRQ